MNFIDIKESAFMALDTVRVNKLRSALTILGVSVGVVTVMFMVSIIQGLNKAFAAQVESLGLALSHRVGQFDKDPRAGDDDQDRDDEEPAVLTERFEQTS